MPEINQLTAVSSLSDGDLLPVYVQSAGDARKAAVSVLRSAILGPGASSLLSQYAAPSATGFSVQINDDSQDVWLILTPVGAYAAGTIVMPGADRATDQQEVTVTCTQSVTALTVNGNGATVTGAPTTISGVSFFRLKFDAVTSTWYRVG